MNTLRLRSQGRLFLVAVLLAGAGPALENTGFGGTFDPSTAFSIFWSATGRMPPLPWPLFPELETEEVGPGVFVYDDTGVDYESLWAESAEVVPHTQTSSMSITSGEEYGCALWLEIGPLTNSAVLLTLHNTFAGKGYQLWTKTDLWLTNWTVETNVVAASNLTEITVAMNGRTNLFFLAVEDYRMTTNSFRGMDSVEANGGVPDTMGAVGPNHFVEILNRRIAVYVKTNGVQLTNASTRDFFAAALTDLPYDPRILYDAQSNRWVASAIVNADSTNLYLAVSKTANPADLTSNNWWTFVTPVSK